MLVLPPLSYNILNRNDKSEHITHLDHVVRIIIVCKRRSKPIFLPETKNAAHRAARQLRAQQSGSQLGRRSKGAGG